jgi:hypothetical protein
MNKIIFSYASTDGHTIVIVNGQVVARDYCLLNSVALLNFIVNDMDFVHADCKLDYEPSNLFACTLDTTYDIILNSKAIINCYLFARANSLNEAYVTNMLDTIVEAVSTKYNVIFEIEWELDNEQIYGSASS